ncbi:MAG: thiolase [candidate division NC10 bacterium]|nr:thiolase [candidate division NC10 bacterium]
MVRSPFKEIAIVGVAESDLGRVPGKTAAQLAAEASKAALEDAGLTKDEVDGVFTFGLEWMPSLFLAEYLNLRPRYSDSTFLGGSTPVAFVEHAAAAITTGLCQVALIAYGSTQASDRSRKLGGRAMEPWFPAMQFEAPFGLLLPIGAYAMAATRHMHLYGTTSERLAEIAVATRKWAALNPKAMKREPITIADVLASPMISSPLHLLDCCLVTDGGGAVVVTTKERAKDLRRRLVTVLGAAEGHTHQIISQMPDLCRTGAVETGARAFAMAGLRPEDIDVAEIYDSFTITVLLSLEDLGFCEKGEGGAFIQGQRTAPGGPFPMNTSGGGLSYCHPGVFGIFLIIEAVHQLRGEAEERQVSGAEVALVHGTGGVFSSHGTLILGRG